VVGEDDAGARLRALLRDAGVSDALVAVPGRATTHKTRIVARGTLIFAQHLARLDRLTREPIPPDATGKLTDAVSKHLPESDVLLISDYRNGVMSPELIRSALTKSAELRVPVVVDAQGALGRYRGATMVKCNRREAESEIGKPLDGDDEFADAAQSLRRSLGAEGVVITRGPDGMTVAWGEEVEHLEPANRSEVFDVTGAGDTVVAVLALALAAGMSIFDGAALANLAAGFAVRHLGNVAVSAEMLVEGAERNPR
jgi:rfaE bifunctional protein kinase chain/domain